MDGPAAQTFSLPCQWLAVDTFTYPVSALRAQPRIEPDWHYIDVACTNAACRQFEIPVTGLAVPDVPEDWGWQGVLCGTCSQPIETGEELSR